MVVVAVRWLLVVEVVVASFVLWFGVRAVFLALAAVFAASVSSVVVLKVYPVATLSMSTMDCRFSA